MYSGPCTPQSAFALYMILRAPYPERERGAQNHVQRTNGLGCIWAAVHNLGLLIAITSGPILHALVDGNEATMFIIRRLSVGRTDNLTTGSHGSFGLFLIGLMNELQLVELMSELVELI